jgi:hypothetical protein
MSGWVCPECGLDYDTITPPDAIVAVRSFPRRYRERMEDLDDEVLEQRPGEGVWSAKEYAAHVADIFDVFVTIIRRMRTEDHPTLPDDWDPDERAVERNYNGQPLDGILDDLQRGAERLGDELGHVPADGWTRTATFDYGERDLLTMARNAVHEGAHHLRDIDRILTDAPSASG